MSQAISEYEIQAYIDNALDDDARERVERACSTQPELARRIHEIGADMALLRRYFSAAESDIPDQRIAETVGRIVDHAPSPRRRAMAGLHVSLRTAAMVALVVVGALGVFGIKVSMTVPAFADAAAVAYLEAVKDPAEEDEPPAPENLIAWLNAQTGLDIHVPYAESHGYYLAEGRLTTFDNHGAALLVYEDGRRHRVAIFVTRIREQADDRHHFAVDRSVHINYWARNGVGLVISAADEQDLKAFSEGAERLIDVSSLPAPAASR